MAVNSVGTSHPSRTIDLTTKEEMPEGPPTDVEATATNSQSLVITWKVGHLSCITKSRCLIFFTGLCFWSSSICNWTLVVTKYNYFTNATHCSSEWMHKAKLPHPIYYVNYVTLNCDHNYIDFWNQCKKFPNTIQSQRTHTSTGCGN